MTEEQKSDSDESASKEGSDEGKDDGAGSGRMGDGIRQGIGVLNAFKDTLEETIKEARGRGDLSTDRAKEVLKETLEKAQTAAGEAKEKLDFANQAEVEAVRGAMDSIRDRVSVLERSVFGAATDEGAKDSSVDAAATESEGNPAP
ncbi:MAG: hypothetical protein OSA81_02540 [Longimicrobiales bacterium]|nr:hypothetical protein [Longimicrobiales bacterium]